MRIRDRLSGFHWRHLYLYFRLTNQAGQVRPFRIAYLVIVLLLAFFHSWYWLLACFVDATFMADARTPGGVKRTGERGK